ncbi:CCR4-NOT transcription complex subunit 11 [Intoshia linei]|uniref:hexokinase n=1 Tax=Intoshia linei TaxID=1819745 RepID=A0A177BBY2_9BILA|nr:CCR4-NOT transcription complex subunit 11 [Intoshia linei]
MYSAIDTTLNAFLLDPETYKEVSRLLSVEIESGLVNNERSSLKMLNSFVTDLPNGSETGSFLALDLGGTNFRVMLIDIDGNAYKSTSNIYYIPESVKIGNSIKMFDLIADSIQDFMIKYNLMDKHMRLGFTFSFPLLQTSLSTGKLISWTKGYKIDDAVGNCINQLLTDAIHRKNLNVSICAILNDTVGTLMTTAFEYHNAKIGVVIGTGTNMCYVEKICNYKKWVNRDSTENSKYVFLLSNYDLISSSTVRIVIISILYYLYSNGPFIQNPFAFEIFSIMKKTKNIITKPFWSTSIGNQTEQFFVSCLVNDKVTDLYSHTAYEIVNDGLQFIKLQNVTDIHTQLLKIEGRKPTMARCLAPSILPSQEFTNSKYTKEHSVLFSSEILDIIVNIISGENPPINSSFAPKLLRLRPPLHIADDELCWINPIVDYAPIIMDNSIISIESKFSELSRLIAKSHRIVLPIEKQNTIYNLLNESPSLVNGVKLRLDSFKLLVEYNPNVAVHCIASMIKSEESTESKNSTKFLLGIQKIGLSLHTLEVINSLVAIVKLPLEFTTSFASNCLRSCEAMNDKTYQNRMIRLVCVFIQSLFRNDLVDKEIRGEVTRAIWDQTSFAKTLSIFIFGCASIMAMFIELQAFCIQYSRIKEAANLFKLVKSEESVI